MIGVIMVSGAKGSIETAIHAILLHIMHYYCTNLSLFFMTLFKKNVIKT